MTQRLRVKQNHKIKNMCRPKDLLDWNIFHMKYLQTKQRNIFEL